MLKTDGRVPICTLVLQTEGNLQEVLIEAGVLALSGLDFDGLDERSVRICVPVLRDLSRLLRALEQAERS
jgi:hypothetical protein